MKQTEIKKNGLYVAKVSGNLVTVRVDGIEQMSFYNDKIRDRTRYHVTNLKTGRKTIFRSAAKFRHPAPQQQTPAQG